MCEVNKPRKFKKGDEVIARWHKQDHECIYAFHVPCLLPPGAKHRSCAVYYKGKNIVVFEHNIRIK